MQRPTFKEPPATRRGKKHGHDWNAIAAKCKSRPGAWVLVGSFDSQGAARSGVRRGLNVATRRNSDGRYDLYVRWATDGEG